MTKTLWLLPVWLVFATSAAALAPEQLALRIDIETVPGSALQRLEFDDAVYRALRRDDLGDVRVFNAAGEALPMARLPVERREREVSKRVALTPLPEAPTGEGGAASVTVGAGAGEARVQVELRGNAPPAKLPLPQRLLADTAGFRHALHMVELPLAADIDFEGRVRLESSDDLARWRTLASDEPVLAVGRGEARLTRLRVTLAGTPARYLRLSWLGAVPSPAPAELLLIHLDRPAPPRREWLALEGRREGAHIDYLAPGRYPFDQLRLAPVAGNDVLAAQVESRAEPSARWRPRVRTVGYRLESAGELRQGPPAAFAPTRDRLWRVLPERPELAGAPPRLELGWQPEEIVFVARGAAPFRLAVGHPDAAPAWLPVAEVVPGYGREDEAPMAQARLRPQVPPPPAALPPAPWQPGPHWWLWGALLAGVALLAWMARGLWRELGRSRE